MDSCRRGFNCPLTQVVLTATAFSPTQINIESAAAASRLCREEWFEQACKRREITCLNQQLAWSAELGDDAFAAHHAAKEPSRRFAQRVLSRSFPRDQMARIDDVAFPGLQGLAMNGAERGN